MSSSETVKQYFTRVTDLVNKMRVYREYMPDSKVVEKILRTMPMKYDHVVTMILESHNMDTMMIAELQGTIESQISRILEKSEKSTKEALKSQVNFNNVVESSRTQRQGHGFNFQSRGRGSFRGRGRGNYNQGIYNNFTPPNQGRGGTNFSNRMTGRKELFSSIDDSVKLLLKFGNSTKIPIEGKWHITIRLKVGSLSYISDVFYALELDYNLLSMGQLSEKGYKMITYHGYFTVFDKQRKFGYFNFSGLNYLSRKGLVSGLP
ncbi:uncharacterized protein LOC130957177 [Arachis stenosperma]|uniref:uncharacterized protein LOC130957177 n=1 Tax=Arachis stenosperma TaxID=217475 RepID=UPI0025ACED6D|nr:uncharacterized protein LOC130957177 [Arachis stenosperma]